MQKHGLNGHAITEAVIYNISPVQTPFMTSVGKAKATQTLHEWQTDALASADTSNAQLQGDDVSSFDAETATTRLGNVTQISRKTLVITDTLDVVKKAGRKSEVAYQVAKKLKELKRDMEAILTNNQAKVTGGATTAPTLAALGAWVHTNTSKASDGGDPTGDGTNTRTDGTQRAFTEVLLKNVLKSVYDNSGEEPNMVMLGTFNKQVFSTFGGNAMRMNPAESGKLMAAVDRLAA